MVSEADDEEEVLTMESPETVHVIVYLPAGAEHDTDRRSAVEPLWSWRQRALCRGMDSSVFLPSEAESLPTRRRREQVAKTICAACPVRPACAAYALANREPHGVWGGLSEADRAAAWYLADDSPDPPVLGDPGRQAVGIRKAAGS